MQEINYTDRSFNPDSSEIYSLSVQANSGGFAYSVFDNAANQVVLFRKYRFDQVILISDMLKSMTDILDSDSVLGLSYSSVKFIGYSRHTTLVPEKYFDPDAVDRYLTLNNGEELSGTPYTSFISSSGIYNVFSLPDEIVSLLSLFFKKVEFLSQSTVFLKRITSEDSFRNSVYAGLNPDFFDIACTGPNGLLLYNTFQYASETDLLYYILFVYNCMGFEPGKVPLIISGEHSSKLIYLDLLRQYFADTIIENLAQPVLASGLKQLNASRFLNLLVANTCESSVENIKEGK